MSKRLFPELDKLAACSSDIELIRSFLGELNDKGYEFGRWDGDTFYPANLELDKVIHKHFDIDLTKVEHERRLVLAQFNTQKE